MHLKSCPPLVRSELRVDACGVQSSQRSGRQLRTCSGNHGNISSSRLPFGVLSTNTLRRGNTTSVASLRLKAPPATAQQRLPPPPGSENNTLRLYRSAAEDADAPLDIWAVIKPGHVREKIAIFASDGEHTDGSEHTATGSSDNRDRTPVVCMNNGAASALSRSGKAKGTWEENSNAKRRRRSGNNQNPQQDPRTRVQDTQQHALKPPPRRSDSTQQTDGGGEGVTALTTAVAVTTAVTAPEEDEEQKVSVVEMVAFLEQRANEQQPDSKPLLAVQRSSTTITLSRAPPPEVKGEEPESVRVSDMVARLESACLKRREGDLSRSNSLRRNVGRVLLAVTDQSPAPCRPPSPSSVTSSLTGAQSVDGEPISCSETPASALTTPPSGETQSAVAEAPPLAQAPPPPPEDSEPLPGLLFLSQPLAAPEPRPPLPRQATTITLEPAPTQPRPSPARRDSGSQSEQSGTPERAEEEEGARVALGRRASASQDFLEKRQRLRRLLEPQPFLAALPHHLLLQILALLPTRSLAALTCTCRYFNFIVRNYGVRPADSLWVSDPRYRDDPCKQCKKRYGRGDVSLCRWHHKPYCQAQPYGPGYWMCCYGARRDAPGCNVGLHDNRWVPAFHSISVPMCVCETNFSSHDATAGQVLP